MFDHRPDRRLVSLGLLAPGLGLAACGQARGAAGLVPDDNTLGDPKAKVSVVEYASVACPVCGRWFKEVWPAFKAKYVDTGKVRFTYREMLVGGAGEVAIAAAGFLLARCAGRDRYFPIVDSIYASQPRLFDDPHGVLLGVARSAGLSETQFNACVQDDAALAKLQARTESNAKMGGVQATPTFVINGKALEAGYQPLATLDAAIAKAQAA